MLLRASQRVISASHPRFSHVVRHSHSAGPTYTSFPATLQRINAGKAFKLFPFERYTREDGKCNYDVAGVQEDDVAWTENLLFFDRATLMPNTFQWQEMIRWAADHYTEDRERGASVEKPFIFSVKKGTVVPTSLKLVKEHVSQFALLPSRNMSVLELSTALNEFYSAHADKEDIHTWLSKHEYGHSFDDAKEEEWTTV